MPQSATQLDPIPRTTTFANLTAETESLDTARTALRAGQPAKALAALDDFGARFPRAALAPEATVLRIETLRELGNRAAADRLADAFLRAQPNSPLAERVRKLRSTNP